MGRRASDKQQRLVRAAADGFHRGGLKGPSIAEIARAADVPAGNVFYYFRTRDDLVRAVVEHWIARIHATLDAVLPAAPPDARLTAFLDGSAARAETYARLGCPLVTLARDLRQEGRGLAPLAAQLMRPLIEWIDTMLGGGGGGGSGGGGARTLRGTRPAEAVLATLQGSFQLAFALGDPHVVHATVDQLKRQLAAP